MVFPKRTKGKRKHSKDKTKCKPKKGATTLEVSIINNVLYTFFWSVVSDSLDCRRHPNFIKGNRLIWRIKSISQVTEVTMEMWSEKSLYLQPITIMIGLDYQVRFETSDLIKGGCHWPLKVFQTNLKPPQSTIIWPVTMVSGNEEDAPSRGNRQDALFFLHGPGVPLWNHRDLGMLFRNLFLFNLGWVSGSMFLSNYK